MFPFPIATPQGCDIQTFYGCIGITAARSAKTWNKPVGVSHVYMMLIGAGGTGDGTNGGGSGGVTVWYGSAQHVPNSLVITPAGTNGEASAIQYRGNSLVTLLTASGATGSVGPTKTAANQFTASGFFNSTDGQDAGTGNTTPSTITFLSAGTDGGSSLVTANYGYDNANGGTGNAGAGYFQMQPIIVGVGATSPQNGGIGCGGGSAGGAKGGAGMVLIASW